MKTQLKKTLSSHTITSNPILGAAQAMLYATVKNPNDIKKPHIGICSMWYQGNPCNMHTRVLADKVDDSVTKNKLLSRQFNTIGVSDGISMGTSGMSYSLPSRELIANSIETQMLAMFYDGIISIPSCDKNMPGALMGMLRANKPGFIIYGGSIKPGCFKGKDVDVVDAFQSYGLMKANKITVQERKELLQSACPGSGACGGMYTANTMAVMLEAMGLTMPNSSSNMAESYEKENECNQSGIIMSKMIDMNLTVNDIVTKKSLINGIKVAMVLGGSTNLVLHVLAIAHEAGIDLTLEDIQKISDITPLLGNLKPSGEYVMYDIYKAGGLQPILKYLLDCGILDGTCITISGNTLFNDIKNVKSYNFDKNIIVPIDKPFKTDSHIQVLYGDIANKGSVAKITGKEGTFFTGYAMVFTSEEDVIDNLDYIKEQSEKKSIVIIIAYQGPSVGMPEMLKATSSLAGIGILDKVALLTDGRFSGGSHGFVIGHISPEAYKGGPIANIRNGDRIVISTDKKLGQYINNESSPYRDSSPVYKTKPKLSGWLGNFSDLVSCASTGCITTHKPYKSAE